MRGLKLVWFLIIAIASQVQCNGAESTATGAPSCACGIKVAVRKAGSRATTNVSAIDYAFNMQNISINVGDTVTWKNDGPSAHTTTSDTGLWDSGSLNPGSTFSYTFNTAGTFPYHCSLHQSLNMIGTVVVNMINPPSITSASTASGTQNLMFAGYNITATNSPGSYGATGLPTGLFVDASTGMIFGTPMQFGTFQIQLSATNAGGTGTATLTLTVTPAGNPPTITSATTVTGLAGAALTFQITATNSPTSFSASGLPPGLTIDPNSGIIAGVPQGGNVTQATVVVYNDSGQTSGQLTFMITNPPSPRITSATTANGFVGVSFSYSITAITFAKFDASGLPAGLSVTSNGNISGMPQAPGVFMITLSAVNPGGSTTQILTLTVVVPVVPQITSPLSAVAVLGYPFDYSVSVTGVPSEIAVTATPLPTGFILSGSKITAVPGTAGTFVITLTATNSIGSSTQSLTVTVADPAAGGDSDGDGVPDALEIDLGTSPVDSNSVPLNVTGMPATLQLSKVLIKLNFVRAGSDGISFGGMLPVPSGFTLAGQTFVVDVGGVVDVFTLDSKGAGKVGNDQFKLTVKAKNGMTTTAGVSKFTATFVKGSFASTLASVGLVGTKSVKNEALLLPVIALFNKTVLKTTQTIHFTAMQGKTGMAK